ncbi:Uncharacterized protein BP5553_05654 [Venustampulla echinocandica]|uniref:2EXR domain-containing protein n=1 Tax=Venustampulla echinocandica TaxID=2656787 RepID=A0A370TL95_9HELO|nr:Uncharacterized protein BP5553_05654 [Venustampulla echinocandica]RDL36302.1 Uncharacterized protein BP5553_05654 [Venustampulla echinocandica]
MTSGGENKQLSPLSTFPRFSDLAIELRIQIWQDALHSATTNRAIPVAINHHPAVTMHSCIPLLGSFCGQHSHCPSYNFDSGQPSSSVACMFNGYFSLPANTSDIEDYALHSLSLACTESRSVVLLLYPETMTIYRKMWYPDVESHQRRQVRCNPATDTLLVKAVPSYSSEQRHPSLSLNNPGDLYHQDLEKWFPQNADIFASFRYIISRFRHVVFSFLSDFQTPRPLMFSGAFDCTLFQQFLIFFERLEHLYLCSDPEYLTAVREWERVENIEDPRDGSMDNMDLQNFVGVSSGILNCDYGYNNYVRVHSELSADSGECCWVPMPKGFGGSWLFCSRDVFDKKW